MACGLPVVAPEGTGAAEIVTAGENGLLVPPGDSDALAAALSRLLADGDERERLGVSAREFAVREGDSEKCARKLERFYESVVAFA
jgi:glycosyltransferase involved in cell wall biosynthesis